MTTSDSIAIVGLFVTTIGGMLVLAFYMGSVHREVKTIARNLERVIDDVSILKLTVGQMLIKVEVLWHHHFAKSNSPIALNEAGLRLLGTSKIGEFASQRYNEVIIKIRELNPKNAYQAQEALISVMTGFKNNSEYNFQLQETAFSSGSDVDSLLFVAALTIRDRVILELGF